MDISHAEKKLVSQKLLSIKIYIGHVEKNASQAQDSVRAHVVLDILYAERKIVNGTQPLTEITIALVGTNV